MREANKRARAGQEVRMADIPADAGRELGLFENLHQFNNGAELAKALCYNVTKDFGAAGIAWLKVLTDIVNDPTQIIHIKKMQKEFVEDILSPHASSQITRVAARMGLIAAAGEYATNAKITGWPISSTTMAVKACFKAWVEQRGSVENQEVSQSLAQVRAFFEANGESQFSRWDETETSAVRTRDRAGFWKINPSGEIEYYVFTEAYTQRICKGLNKRDVTKPCWRKVGSSQMKVTDLTIQSGFPKLGLPDAIFSHRSCGKSNEIN